MNWWKRRGKFSKLLMIVGAFVLVIAAVSSGGDEDAATVTTTTQAVAAVVTTEATTTSTTTPSQDPAAQAYTQSVVPILLGMQDALSTVADVTGRWPNWTDEDQLRLIIALGTMQTMESSISALSPPASLDQVHTRLLDAGKHMKASSQLMATGIDNMDADTLNAGANEMLEGNKAINDVNTLISAMP
ncbi:MAG: hypothetical protein LC667_14015 [Thioalkalivibrio sp.]|nr:hypothetical protein [Thioalkalivibrio sp.]